MLFRSGRATISREATPVKGKGKEISLFILICAQRVFAGHPSVVLGRAVIFVLHSKFRGLCIYKASSWNNLGQVN